jgi:hypothetical protein
MTDLEDGSHPIYTYGRDTDEILRKLASQNANSQIALVRRAEKPATPVAIGPSPQLPTRRTISPDQLMVATEDLKNPAKSGAAVATLLEAATGIDPAKLIARNYREIAEAWAANHPDFYEHNGNVRLMTQTATNLAGGNLAHVTAAHLDKAFEILSAEGSLFDRPPLNPDAQPSNTFPDESQVQRTERPRGTRFAIGASSTSFQRHPATTRTLKYTEEQIRSMPLSKSDALIKSNDKDYADACEFYFGQSAQARA